MAKALINHVLKHQIGDLLLKSAFKIIEHKLLLIIKAWFINTSKMLLSLTTFKTFISIICLSKETKVKMQPEFCKIIIFKYNSSYKFNSSFFKTSLQIFKITLSN